MEVIFLLNLCHKVVIKHGNVRRSKIDIKQDINLTR